MSAPIKYQPSKAGRPVKIVFRSYGQMLDAEVLPIPETLTGSIFCSSPMLGFFNYEKKMQTDY